VQDIVGLLFNILFVAQTMFKEIALPGDGMASRQSAFPKSDNLGESFVWREANQKVDVIGHQHGEMAEPNLLLVVKPDGIEKGSTDNFLAKMVLLSWLSAKGDEIICIG
jgi:hypothetical protein